MLKTTFLNLQHRNRIFSETNQKQKRLYQILRQAKNKNYKVQLFPLYWSKETDKAAIKADITAHEALLIRKYIPVLNLEIPWYNGKRDYINKIAYTITLPQILSLPIVEIPIARPEEEQT